MSEPTPELLMQQIVYRDALIAASLKTLQTALSKNPQCIPSNLWLQVMHKVKLAIGDLPFESVVSIAKGGQAEYLEYLDLQTPNPDAIWGQVFENLKDHPDMEGFTIL